MFSLSKLTPDREPFDLGNGQTIYFRNRQDFDFQELAAWQRLSEEMKRVTKDRQGARNEQKHASISRRTQQTAMEIITLVLPELPNAILDGLTAGQVDQLAGMCITVCSGSLRSAAASIEDVEEAMRLYPDLNPEFLTSLNRQQMALLLKQETEPEKN